ncbi:MAG TPA: triose-phosphate isomerase [Thermoanaerobaculia bacterium]|jgi:triosephosphate isomerase|nr:triose-phosphate isomerase [Thermoanaerobaculia bacterium]
MSAERRRPLIAANWKMNLLKADAVEYCRDLRRGLAAAAGTGTMDARVVIFPSFPLIPIVARELVDSEVEVGGQDLHPEDRGANTGDVSGPQLVDAGCTWVLCGHSERRQNHGESDEWVGLKVAAAARHHQLTPLICVGETRDERKAGQTFTVLARQLGAALAGGPEPFALAYEPIWAIGTGETATPEIAQEAHRYLRGRLAEELGEAAAAAVPILYGGSVTPDNAPHLIVQPDLDGFLVGGASLDPQKFLAIIRSSG